MGKLLRLTHFHVKKPFEDPPAKERWVCVEVRIISGESLLIRLSNESVLTLRSLRERSATLSCIRY